MGKGIDLARVNSPELADLMEDMRDQLLIVFLKRLGGKISIPVNEIDDTGGQLLTVVLDSNRFIFGIEQKQ